MREKKRRLRAAKPKSPSEERLKQEIKIGQKAVLPGVIFSLPATVFTLGQIWCVTFLLAHLLAKTPEFLIAPLIGFIVAAALRAICVFFADHYAFAAGVRARRRLRNEALVRLFEAGPAFLKNRHSAEWVSVVIDRTEAVKGLFSRRIPATILLFVSPLLVLIAAGIFYPWAVPVFFLSAFFVIFAMAVSGIGAALASRRQFLALERLQIRFLDRVRGIATILLANRVEDEAEALNKAAQELRVRTLKVLKKAFLGSVSLDLAAAAVLIFFAIRFAFSVRAGDAAEIGGALFVLLCVPEFFAPFRAFSAAYQDKNQAKTAMEAMCDLPPLKPAPTHAVRTVTAKGITVTFDEVSFSWDKTRRKALEQVSFRVPAGETLILRGPSGSGKSTIFEVLLGFVRPDSGRVTLSGAEISDIVPQALSKMTCWISQNPVLFAGTIEDNIRFAKPEATEEEVLQAARSALVTEFADSLPNRLKTVIGEGGYGLSGGQAQRIAVARAFLKNAPLLLLDEPTAHLDPVTEASVFESLKTLSYGKTVILATHSTTLAGFTGQRLDLKDGQVMARIRRSTP